MIPELLNSQAVADLAIALLHSLWQGLVLAVILFVILRQIPAGRSNLRYRLSVLSLFAILLCWMGTFSILQYEPESKINTQTPIDHSTPVITVTDTANQYQTVEISPTDIQATTIESHYSKPSHFGWSEWLVVVWALGVVIMLGRIFVALAGTTRLRRDAIDITDDAIIQLFERLCRKMQIKRTIRFATSSILTHPGVIGFFKPVMLIPASILSEISTEDLQAIIAHELAHIRRYDYLVNFCQMIIEAVLFFNPMVWWISRRIRIEREACCDMAGIEITGKPMQYAQTLLDQLCRTAASDGHIAAAMTGFSDDNESASTERIKRIVHPGRKPQMKIGWVKLSCWMVVSTLVLATVWKTTDVTIAMAAKILTPAERIEKMNEVAETHSSEYPTYGQTDRVTVSGSVKTYDDKPLPRHASIRIKAYGPKHSSSIYFNVFGDGTFKHRTQYHENIFVIVEVPGYAPAISETFHPEPNDIIENVNLILTEGFISNVKVVDKQGNPVPNAALEKNYSIQKDNGWSSYGSTDKATSDENGIAVFEHCLERPIKLHVQANGYSKIEDADYMLRPNETLTITMEKGLIAAGTVVAAKTGEPVAGAKFKLVYRERPGHGWHYGMGGDKYETITDESGTFELNTLENAFKYTYVIEADGYNSAPLGNVQPGDKNITIKMLPELYIRGTIIGDLGKIKTAHSQRIGDTVTGLRFTSRYASDYDLDNIYENDAVPVEIRDGVGYFTINNIIGDEITLTPAGTEKHVKLKINGQSIDDVVIDLDVPDTQFQVPTRQMILTFQSPEGYPPVEGKTKIWYMTKEIEESDDRRWSGIDMHVENGIGIIDFPVSAYWRLADTKGLKGFWFRPTRWDTKPDNFIIESDEPYEHTMIAEPGGSIYGQLLDEQGELKRYAEMKLLLVERPEQYMNLDNNQFHFIKWEITQALDHKETETGKFNTPTLPLGGTYAVVARDNNTWMFSDPIKLTEENPIREVTLRIDKLKQISGQILLPDGTPAKDVEITLNCKLSFSDEDSYSISGSNILTDQEGLFIFNDINPKKPLEYKLCIKGPPGYQGLNVKAKAGSNRTYRLQQGYTFKGRIIDHKTGWPIPGIWVHAEKLDRSDKLNQVCTSDKPTNMDGYFVFTSLNDERYRLYSGEVNFTISQKDREIIGGQSQEQEYRVNLQKWSRCKPRKPDDEE